MARLHCLCLVLAVVSARASEDAQVIVQEPALKRGVPGGVPFAKEFRDMISSSEFQTAFANGVRIGSSMKTTGVVKETVEQILKWLNITIPEPGTLDENTMGNLVDKLITGLKWLHITKLVDKQQHPMSLALNYATAGEKAEEVGFVLDSLGCTTDTECSIKEGDVVEMSMKDFSFALGSTDMVSIEMHLQFDESIWLQSLAKTHPDRVFRFECPACGAKCKLSMDKTFPGLMLAAPTMFQTVWNKVTSLGGFSMTQADVTNFWNREVELTMPACPQVLTPFQETTNMVWKMPELPEPWQPLKPLLTTVLQAGRAANIGLTSKVAFKHADGSLIWGLTSTAKLS